MRDFPPWQLVTDSSLPHTHFVREAAILILAEDALLGEDSRSAENAVAWSRKLMDDHEDAEHYGDCVKQAITCLRCLCDDAKALAQKRYDE